jgi:hypothetical protein
MLCTKWSQIASFTPRSLTPGERASNTLRVELHYTRFIKLADRSKWTILNQWCQFCLVKSLALDTTDLTVIILDTRLGIISVWRLQMDTRSFKMSTWSWSVETDEGNVVYRQTEMSVIECGVRGRAEVTVGELMKPVSVGASLWR